MCEPITIAAVAGLSAAAIGQAGSYIQAYGQWEEGEQNARAAQRNRFLSELSAGDALQRGEQDAGRLRMAATQAIGAQKVAAGASGVDTDSKSTLDIMSDTRLVSELDAQTIRNNAAREAWGYKVQGMAYGDQARQARARAQREVTGTLLGGFARTLSSVSSIAGVGG